MAEPAETSALPLPAPWRLFFYSDPSIETSGNFYQALSQAYLSRHKTQLSNDHCHQWEASQSDSRIQLSLEGDKELHANYQIIGSFDGRTFLWGDENPSLAEHLVQDAKQLRQKLRDKGYDLASRPKFQTSVRDSLALLSLAAQELEAQCCFAGSSGRTLILMTLSGIEKGSGKTITERIFKASTPSPFEFLQEVIDKQIADLQPDDQELVSVETSLEEAFQAHKTEDFSSVLKIITSLKERLGPSLNDMEPAGWLYLCEGSALLALGQREEAVTAFENAGRTIRTFDNTVRMLGLSRSVNSDEAQLSNLYGAYIRNSDRFMEIASEAEKDKIRSKLEMSSHSRNSVGDTPQEIWRAALTAYRELEKTAYELSQEISEFRSQSEVYYEKYRISRQSNDKAWREFCLAWMTPGRNSMLGSFASEPSHCPDLETITEIKMVDDLTCSILTERDGRGLKQLHRYELLKTQTPLASQPRWLLDKVWSVWENEEILLFE